MKYVVYGENVRIVTMTKINNKVQFGQALNPLKNVAKVSSIDNTSALQDVFTKIDKFKKLWDDGSMDYDRIRYFQGRGKSIKCTRKWFLPIPTCLI